MASILNIKNKKKEDSKLSKKKNEERSAWQKKSLVS